MGEKIKLPKNYDATIRAINIVITTHITGTAIVRSYPDTDNTLYKIPLYKMIVTGTDHKNNIISKNFEILRFGIYTNNAASIYEQLIGLSNNKSYSLQWISDIMDGVWQVYEDWLIIPGSPDPTTEIWGATGCIEVCGPNAWDDFINFIIYLTGSNNLNAIGVTKKITLTCTKAILPEIQKY